MTDDKWALFSLGRYRGLADMARNGYPRKAIVEMLIEFADELDETYSRELTRIETVDFCCSRCQTITRGTVSGSRVTCDVCGQSSVYESRGRETYPV
jgi:hypothetical protein